jgi:hypothetical protein
MSYRSSIATSIGFSPFRVLFGRDMRVPIDNALLQHYETFPDIQSYMAKLIPKLKLTQELAKQNLNDSNQTTKEMYDKKTAEPSYALGSKVLLHDPTTKKGQCPKLKRRWTGPYIIVDKSGDGLLYKLRHCNSGKEQKSLIHANRIKTFVENRDGFYTRTKSDTSLSPVPPSGDSQQNSSQIQNDGWFEIKRVLKRKKSGGKEMFQVHWADGSKSWEPSENVSEYAKSQYFVAQKRKQKRRKHN